MIIDLKSLKNNSSDVYESDITFDESLLKSIDLLKEIKSLSAKCTINAIHPYLIVKIALKGELVLYSSRSLKDVPFSIDEEELVFIMDSSKMPISIYTPFENDQNGLLLIDRFKAFDETENVMTKIMLKEALKTLPERERKIVLLRYFRDKTQSEIAKELQISQVQVSRLENKVLETLKEKLSI